MDEHDFIRVASFNCQGFKPRNYDFIKNVLSNFSIIFIQEHWLFNFEFNKFLDILPNFSYHATSSMNENCHLSGRPYGGTGILIRNNLNAVLTPVMSSTPRVCAATLVADSLNLLLLSVYMPTDQTNHDAEFQDVLNELTSLQQQYDQFDLIIGGDFNSDVERRNWRSDALMTWCEAQGLTSPALLPGAPRRPTHYTHDGRPSVLDYIIVSDDLRDSITSWSVVDTGDILSDHRPTTANVRVRLASLPPLTAPRRSIPAWAMATDANIAMYKLSLDNYLSRIRIPSAAAICNEYIDCDIHERDYNTLLNDILTACQRATSDAIPHRRTGGGSKPGWNEEVRAARATSLWWHERWKEAGRPREGWVARIRRNTRAKYHRAVKARIQNAKEIVRNKVRDSASESDPRRFWMEVSKINKSKKEGVSVIDGQVGEHACNAFRNKYERLFNANPSKNLASVVDDISDKIANKCCNSQSDNCNHHMHKISICMVKKAVSKLKQNQSDPQCNIVSDCLLNGSDKLFTLLAILFSIMIRHGYQNNLLNTTSIVPIPKDKKKSLSNSDNYRGIAPNNLFMKILDYMILDKFQYVFETSENQFAYKPEHSTSMCTFMALETIQYYANAGSSVYCILLDCTKAFDFVRFDLLFSSLLSHNMCPLIVRLIVNLYVNAQYCVKWNNCISDCFPIQNGVKQGGVVSPLMFTLVLESVVDKVTKSKLGCYVGSKCVSILVFADDILILSPTRSAAQKILNICYDFTESVGLKFNKGKCKVMIFNSIENFETQLLLGGTPLECVNTGIHIGNYISNISDLVIFDELINGIAVKTNSIFRIFHQVDFTAKCKLFNSQCCSLYGIELLDLESFQLDRLLVQWRKSIRYVLGLHPRTHSYLLPHIVGSPNIEGTIYSRLASFFKKGYFSNNSLVASLFKNCVLNYSSIMCRNINIILRKLNLNLNEFLMLSECNIKQRCKGIGMPDPDWRVGVVMDLLGCRDGAIECGLTKDEVEDLLKSICID